MFEYIDRRQVNSSYSGVGTDFSSAPIDVIADVRTEKVPLPAISPFCDSFQCVRRISVHVFLQCG